MASNVEMKSCPSCGTLLLGSLVDAINNPTSPECCPKFGTITIDAISDDDPQTVGMWRNLFAGMALKEATGIPA